MLYATLAAVEISQHVMRDSGNAGLNFGRCRSDLSSFHVAAAEAATPARLPAARNLQHFPPTLLINRSSYAAAPTYIFFRLPSTLFLWRCLNNVQPYKSCLVCVA